MKLYFMIFYCLFFYFFSTILEGKNKLRLLTYNIHHGQGMDRKYDYTRLSEVIISTNPDVVALQEVDNKTKRSHNVDQPSIISKLTGLNVIFQKSMDYQGGQYGVAILSKFPIVAKSHIVLPTKEPFKPKVVLIANIIYNNFDFYVASAHLCHQDQKNRVKQATAISNYFLLNKSKPVILMGDLNAVKGSPTINHLLNSMWFDTSSDFPKLKTFRNKQIDFILVRKQDSWTIKEVRTIDDKITSDHKPLLTVLEI